MQKRTLSSLTLVAFTAIFPACSSSSDTGAGGGASTSTTSATTTSSDATTTTDATTTSTGSGPECHGPDFEGPADPQVVESVDATVVDLAGEPVKNMAIQVCGLDICLYGNTDSSGHFFIDVDTAATPSLDHPAFKYGDGIEYPRFAAPMPKDAEVVIGTVNTAPLPPIAEGVPMVAGGSATSGDVTLTFAADASITIDELSFGETEQQNFRAVTIPVDKALPAVDPTLGLEMLFGATPFETVFCPPAKVTVPNSEGWDAGTEVEFYVHGVSYDQEYAPYAGWSDVSGGKVSDDGATISTNDGEGLPLLSVFGLKRK